MSEEHLMPKMMDPATRALWESDPSLLLSPPSSPPRPSPQPSTSQYLICSQPPPAPTLLTVCLALAPAGLAVNSSFLSRKTEDLKQQNKEQLASLE